MSSNPTLSPIDQARANQRQAADPSLSVFVTANAGSGKTTTLVDRVARLLLEEVAPGEILCVTYTKAAAAEMQARLFAKLGGWAVADDRALAADLAKLDGRDPAALSDADLSKARKLFARALETPGGLKIQTIHAFCEKLLKRFPLEAGVSPGFRVLEDAAAVALSHEAREDLARAALADPDGKLGAAYAHFAVQLDWGSFYDLLDMIEKRRGDLVGYLERIDAGTAPGPQALAGADPDRTPAEIEADFLDWIDGSEWSRVSEAMATGSANDQSCAARMDAASPTGGGLGRWSIAAIGPVFLTGTGEPRKSMGTKKAPPWAVEWLNALQLKFLAVLDVLRAARVADDTEKALTLARIHAALYTAAKVRQGALDFSDLVEKTVELLTVRASAAWVLFKLDGGIEHVLIDEAQDTAPEQWDIFKALTEAFFSGAGAARRRQSAIPRTVFAVGDEKQSIYSFQGARPERLREERRDYMALVENAGQAFSGPDLTTSFRSTVEVLAFVDAAFESPERTRALVGEHGDSQPHLVAREDQHGAVDLWPLFEDPDAPDREAWNAPVDKEGAHSARKKLALSLARDIKQQVEIGVGVHDRTDLRPARYGDFLVLVRRRDATFEEIIRALKTEGVPVAGADRLKLSSHIVFDDLISLARFALYPEDDLSLAEVLRSPLCDVGDFGDPSSLYELAGAEPRRGSLWGELKRRAHEQPHWTQARDLLAAAIADRDRDPFAFFSTVLNRPDITGQTGRARILARLGREAEEAIDETLAQVLSAEDRGGSDLETCLSLLEAADVEVKREMEGARNEVRVMTVHGAKGLEAPIVILPDTTSRAKPQGPTLMPVALENGGDGWLMCPGRAGDDCPASAAARQARVDRTDAETLRLLYVALTRARDRLVIMGRALKSEKTGYAERSWWDVIAETFARLDEDDEDNVRDIGEGRLRFGADPQILGRGMTADVAEAVIPAWATQAPPRDAVSRLAAPSKMDEPSVRIPAPSPLARITPEGAATSLGRFRRGDLIHRLLERLPEIAPEARPDAAVRMLARERDLDDDQRTEMIAAAFGVLDDARFAPVFGPGSRAEVALAGAMTGSDVSISGRIDRLVITPERVLVVDYKSNRPAPDRVEGADPAYVLQMAVYVAVLKRLYPDRAVEAALVWTDGPRLMAVPGDMMDAALAGR